MVLLFFSFSVTKAEGEFLIDSNVEYKVLTTGFTQVTHKITLENILSNIYATTYKLKLENVAADSVSAYDGSGQLDTQIEVDGDMVIIKVNFSDPVVGKGSKRQFNVSYLVNGLAQKTGEVWEVTAPRLSDENSYRFYQVELLIPNEFKNEAYMSPQPTSRGYIEGYKTYTFSKEIVSKTGIMAGFGDFQVFSFNLTYHIENPLSRNESVDIAIPPDTSYQKVYYEVISPKPYNITIDEDGNWLATFMLKPRERVDVAIKGSVQIFSGSRQFTTTSEETLSKNLLPSEYWQTQDPEILSLAASLKTPKEIYKFVSTHLQYDYTRVKPNLERMGSKKALELPQNAICMEFTDLFIAISRAAGIPAREINGFAYTENKDIQPLSLVADVLHSWPEYWDKSKQAWIPIDPTWASTTGGVDFFNKLDLRHFTFVIHGVDSTKPYPPGSYKLGTNPQKDVFVNFGTLPENRNSKISLSYKKDKYTPFGKQNIFVYVKNDGTQSEYNVILNTIFDNVEKDTVNVGTLPPYAQREFKVTIPYSFISLKNPKTISILYKNDQITIPTSKNEVVILNLLVILIIIVVITLLVLIKLGKVKPNRLIKYLKYIKFKSH